MKGTPFTVLYESVLSKIKDYDFLNLDAAGFSSQWERIPV